MKFENHEQLRQYVDSEVDRVLPEGWTARYRRRADGITRATDNPQTEDFEWYLSLSDPASTLVSSYLLRFTNDMKLLFFICGNSDAGSGNKCLDQAINARIFELFFLKHCRLGDLLDELMKRTRPNIEGIG